MYIFNYFLEDTVFYYYEETWELLDCDELVNHLSYLRLPLVRGPELELRSLAYE